MSLGQGEAGALENKLCLKGALVLRTREQEMLTLALLWKHLVEEVSAWQPEVPSAPCGLGVPVGKTSTR